MPPAAVHPATEVTAAQRTGPAVQATGPAAAVVWGCTSASEGGESPLVERPPPPGLLSVPGRAAGARAHLEAAPGSRALPVGRQRWEHRGQWPLGRGQGAGKRPGSSQLRSLFGAE